MGIIFAAAAVLYLLSLRAYYVGFFNDDAFYIIGARSLLGGSYSQLNVPGHPPLIQYFPGYPILLSPIAALAGGHLWPYQLTSVVLSLAALFFLWRYSRSVPSPAREAALAVSALNPLMVSMSGTVLAEPAFTAIVLACLYKAGRIWRSGSHRDWAGLSVAAGFAVLVRPTGIALPAALAGALAMERRWTKALFALLPGIMVGAFFLARNEILAGHPLLYALEFADPYRAGWGVLPGLVWRNLTYYTRFLFVTTLFRWPVSWLWLDLSTVVVAAGLCLAGMFSSSKEEGGRVPVLFVALYLGAHLFWSKQAGRYVLPAAPLLTCYLFQGLTVAEKRMTGGKIACIAAAAASLLLSIGPIRGIVRASWRRDTALTSPAEHSYAWARGHSDPKDIFAVELDGRFYLYTGRPTLHLPNTADAGEFWDWIRRNGVSFVAVFSDNFILGTPAGARYDPIRPEKLASFLRDSRRFELVFEDRSESSQIYKCR